MWEEFQCRGAESESREELHGWGVRREIGDRGEECERWVSRANYAKHVRTCGRVDVGRAGGYR